MGFSEDDLKQFKELYECFDKDDDGNDKGEWVGRWNLCVHCGVSTGGFSLPFLGYIKPSHFADIVRMLGKNPTEKKMEEWKGQVRGGSCSNKGNENVVLTF